MGFLGLLHAVQVVDGILFDILLEQEEAPHQFNRGKGLRINNLADTAALKMTCFNWSQLRCLYVAFNLEGQLKPMQDKLVLTGHFFNGTPCYDRIHLEEVFIYTLCKLATGLTRCQMVDFYIGGDTTCWMFAYSWMLKYLNQRYVNIIGHQGLARHVDKFPAYRCTIQEYVQRNHQCKLIDGTLTIVPGINIMPWDVFGFIDDSIYRILTPFSGPRGDYEGAARRAKYADAQQAFFSGYVKDHGIKVKTIFLPNGPSTLFGPVSARQADVGVLAMSNLNEFLVELQRGCFITQAGAEVYFCSFGDSAFNLGLQAIQSYYCKFNRGAKLAWLQARCNKAMKLATIAIEKNTAWSAIFFASAARQRAARLL
jgi:hypothetical protein